MSTPFRLTPQDKASALWPKLLTYMQEQRETLRCKNDMPASELETATLRGQIRQLTALIDMDKDRPNVSVQEQY